MIDILYAILIMLGIYSIPIAMLLQWNKEK